MLLELFDYMARLLNTHFLDNLSVPFLILKPNYFICKINFNIHTKISISSRVYGLSQIRFVVLVDADLDIGIYLAYG